MQFPAKQTIKWVYFNVFPLQTKQPDRQFGQNHYGFLFAAGSTIIDALLFIFTVLA